MQHRPRHAITIPRRRGIKEFATRNLPKAFLNLHILAEQAASLFVDVLIVYRTQSESVNC